jgi:VanZ family protein
MFHPVKLVRLVPMLLVMGTIFYLSHQPADELYLPTFYGADKIAHLIAYGTLAFSTLPIYSFSLKKSRPFFIVVMMLFVCGGYGVLDEFHQSFVPGRTVSASDVAADLCGALVVGTIWLWHRRCRRTVEKK